jgi:hypothetical protein
MTLAESIRQISDARFETEKDEKYLAIIETIRKRAAFSGSRSTVIEIEYEEDRLNEYLKSRLLDDGFGLRAEGCRLYVSW